MSAIAGIVRFDGGAVDPNDLERVAEALRPYGPDRLEVMVDGRIGFVNVLMRMTPEDQFDRQPYRNAYGRIITADVRLDNRSDVLERIGVAIKDAVEWSDSRVLLSAWETFGNGIWSMLRGPFAVAIWDPTKNILTLARDHLGVNVLMWHKSESFCVFATMPKGLFAFRDVPRQLNEQKFADFLVLNHCDLLTTIYHNVYRVLPAHYLMANLDGSIEQRRYWSAADIKPIRFSSDQAYADGLRDRLQLAVCRQMRSAFPIGCLLSGGLDSSSIAALAARALCEKGERLSAFTQVPREGFNGSVRPGCYADEKPYVEAIANAAGNIDVTYVRNDTCDDFDDLERVFGALDGPVRNPMNLGWMLKIRNLARTQGRRVLLNGRHGNFSISWEGWSQSADHLRHGRLLKAYKQWLLFYRSTSLSRWGAFHKLILEPLLACKFSDLVGRHRSPHGATAWKNYSPIRADFASDIGVGARAVTVGHDFLYRWCANDRKGATMLADFEGEWAQALKSVTGVEVRDPTSDVDVVSYCLAVPPEQFLAESVDRSLIRRAMWGLLPEIVLTKRLRGVQAADWYEKLDSRRDMIAAEITALSGSPLAKRFIDFNRLARAIADWPTGGWQTTKIVQEYRFVLARGIASARFLAWLESLDRPPKNQLPK